MDNTDFDWKPKECCAVVGAYSNNDPGIALTIYRTLFKLHNRGHESCGVCVYTEGKRFENRRSQAPIYNSFLSGDELSDMLGYMGIGHNRYSTRGDPKDAQPFEIHSERPFAIAHNGTVKNADELRASLEASGERFETKSDSEVLMRLIAQGRDIIDGIKIASEQVKGSYSITIVDRNGVYAARDPHGFKPLCMGRGNDTVVFASESSAFDTGMGIEFERDIERGEIVFAGPDGEQTYSTGKKRSALDIFELVYFARPNSIIDGIAVSEYRMELGRKLARKEFIDPDESTIVSPVPLSGIHYAVGYHEALLEKIGRTVPYREALIRERYVARSFTSPSQKMRAMVADNKHSPDRSIVYGKKIMLIDDSDVRGTTARQISEKLRRNGAKEIHKRNGYAEVINTCPYGIDMKTREEHAAIQVPDINERAKVLGFDSMMYNSPQDLIPNGFEITDFCTHCITNIDPLDPQAERLLRISPTS